jgi:hypothetical protein
MRGAFFLTLRLRETCPCFQDPGAVQITLFKEEIDGFAGVTSGSFFL